MKAIAITRNLPITDSASLVDTEIPAPVATGRDLVVRVGAISVNPVDTKVRRGGQIAGGRRVLGWDAAGVVESVGPDATLFKPGDEVYYAGSITRPGANSELHAVDERIVGRKPARLSMAGAAALPLTAITAWEALFDRLLIDRTGGAHRGRALLVIGGAGGVGSLAIQLAKLAGLRVVATASRPESEKWVRDLGADFVINHREPLSSQVAAQAIGPVDYIANFADTDGYWAAMAGLIRPQGKIVCIVENTDPLDLGLLKSKSVAFVWESMFTRPMFGTDDIAEQHKLLDEVAALVDSGRLRTTLQTNLSPINAANLRTAHAQLESGRTIGKIVLSGW